MKITLQSWEWINGFCCGGFEVSIDTDVRDQLVFKNEETGEEVLRVDRKQMCQAMRAFDKDLVVRLEQPKVSGEKPK